MLADRTRLYACLVLLGVLLLTGLQSGFAQEASFSGIGFLPGGNSSSAWGVSADGNVVVGQGFGTSSGGSIRWED
ncbi:MAG: hypothetical protein R3284_02290, partial [Rubricoccaceae bacterium]|nr:hypothetical protein [Rubricoccaceae bacterium]